MNKARMPREPKFDLSGGVLCLDFANTLSHRQQPELQHDNLSGYSDLIFFTRDSKVISPQLARQILEISAATPNPRAEVFQTAINLREAIYQVFAAVASSREPKRKDVKRIEALASLAMTHRQLVADGSEYRWEWKSDKGGLTWYVLWPIAASAADLLTSDRAARVRECGAKTCAWLFLDESRNHSRRWCDMSVCGNRQKARRHYARQH